MTSYDLGLLPCPIEVSAVEGQNIVMADRVGDEQLVVRWLCLYGADGVVGNSAWFVGVSRFAWSSLPGKVVTCCNYQSHEIGCRVWLKVLAKGRSASAKTKG